jgi:hypothetical protein
MGLKDTVLGWLHQGKPADKDLAKAEEDVAEREYEAEKTDSLLDSRLGTSGDHFDADESAPR